MSQRTAPTGSKNMRAEDLAELAKIFKAMGEVSRLALLKALMEQGELTVGALVDATELSQANVSKHLRHLHQASLVAPRRDGNSIHYRIADDLVYDMCTLCCTRIDEKRAALLRKLTETGVTL